jgi:hypothetical protein
MKDKIIYYIWSDNIVNVFDNIFDLKIIYPLSYHYTPTSTPGPSNTLEGDIGLNAQHASNLV